LPFGTGERIADPAGEGAGLLLQVDLGAVRASFAKDQLGFDIHIGNQLRAIFIIDLVLHIPVVDLGRELVAVVRKVAIVAQRYLVGNFGPYIIAAGDPHVGGIGRGGVGQQVEVLRGPGIG